MERGRSLYQVPTIMSYKSPKSQYHHLMLMADQVEEDGRPIQMSACLFAKILRKAAEECDK